MNGKKIAVLCTTVLLCAAIVLGIVYVNGGFQPKKEAQNPSVPSTSSETTTVATTAATTAAPSTTAATTAKTTSKTTAKSTDKTTTTTAKQTTTTTTVKANTFTVVANQQEHLNAINAERVKNDLSALTMSSALNNAAATRAKELTERLEHVRPDGSSPFTALSENGVGFGYAGENIAAGQWNVSTVMDSWMNSEGHRANILSPNFTQVGVACVYAEGSPYGYYWVQLFVG